jgi:hypothetical protein
MKSCVLRKASTKVVIVQRPLAQTLGLYAAQKITINNFPDAGNYIHRWISKFCISALSSHYRF